MTTKLERKSRPYLCRFIWNGSVFTKIRLVSNQEFVYIVTSIAINFTQPLLHIVKAFLICDVVDNLTGGGHHGLS